MKVTIKAVVMFALLAELRLRSRCLGMKKGATCESPQYLEINKMGLIQCLLHDTFFGVLWYDTTDYTKVEPILHYRNFKKTGPGYDSGEYDIHPNGSLVIKEVSLKHEHIFKVAYLYSEESEPFFIDVHVVVIVKPDVPFPVYDKCSNVTNKCFTTMEDSASVQCTVRGARPNVTLDLRMRTIDGDVTIKSELSTFRDGQGYTSSVEAQNIFQYSNLFILLVCKAYGPPGLLENSESLILAQRRKVEIPLKITTLYIERYSSLELSCTNNSITFVVWKKVLSFYDQTHQLLLYSLSAGEQFNETVASDISLGSKNTLKITTTDLKHEGIYFCIFGDGEEEGLTFQNVTVFVLPVPPYPVITGCDPQPYCVLIDKQRRGSLSCRLTGIHPLVHLEWKLLNEKHADFFTFESHHSAVETNGELIDVTITSTYFVLEGSARVFLECGVTESEYTYFQLKTRLDLYFEGANLNDPFESKSSTHSDVQMIFIVTASLLLVFVSILLVIFVKSSTQARARYKYELAKMLPSILDSEIYRITHLKEKFLTELREKYRDLYDSIQPIPYIKDKLYSVNTVFVEGGMVFHDSEPSGGNRQWRDLKSYRNVFDDERVKSPRRILEGEPGYGKSTVALQVVFDWCNLVSNSVLNDVEILIFLRLRQLGGVSSIYRAIKRFALSKVTDINENQIEEILNSVNSESVVVVLDGFDEYPDRDSSTTTDVMSIIGRQKFENFQVITTTRSSILPKKYPSLTKKIRLTGFDDKAREDYIRKAVVGDDDELVKHLQLKLQENAILSDLCQVPLLFVIFAHMTHENEQFRDLNSVTSFFRHMISCFHSHMKNKMKDDNVRQYDLFETDHGKLDTVALEALRTDEQKIVWKKDELCQKLGHEFYDQYIRIGILVEEESVDIVDDPGTPITKHVQYTTEVRFYHKLFCEWYAAHDLCNYIQQNPDIDIKEYLRQLDPFDVQYLYRFSCGLNPTSAEKIINYLKSIDGGDKFAILCILEKTGKIDNIRNTVRQLCDEGVVISGRDSLMLQRSSMQLLEIAARNNIQIECVGLNNCLQSVDLSTQSIRTTTGLTLRSQIPMRRLHVSIYDRKLTKDEALKIMKFASMCTSLSRLWFQGSEPPKQFKDESVLLSLKEKNIQVKYFGSTHNSAKFNLNCLTGQWERQDDELEIKYDDFNCMG